MKVLKALITLTCVACLSIANAGQLKSIPIEDQGPGKDGKDGSKQNDGKDKKEASKKVN